MNETPGQMPDENQPDPGGGFDPSVPPDENDGTDGSGLDFEPTSPSGGYTRDQIELATHNQNPNGYDGWGPKETWAARHIERIGSVFLLDLHNTLAAEAGDVSANAAIKAGVESVRHALNAVSHGSVNQEQNTDLAP